MKTSLQSRTSAPRAWRVYRLRDGRRIETQARLGMTPACPCCGGELETRGESRLDRRVPLDARALDMDCAHCRRFWSIVQHTERSIRLVRMRRLAAAVRAVGSPASPSSDVAVLA